MTQGEAELERLPTIEFRFVADRFGFIPGSEPLQIGYARKAERALRYWVETIRELFGDVAVALSIAADARILPRYPSWEPTEKALGLLRGWLDELPGGPRGAQSDAEPIVDLATQDAVEQIRIYLGVMTDWASTFRAGVWVASIGGLGSAASTPSLRLLQGLTSIAKVYEIDAVFMQDRIREEFGFLLSPTTNNEVSKKGNKERRRDSTKNDKNEMDDDDSSAISSGLARLSTLIESDGGLSAAGEKAIRQATSVSDFAANPDHFFDWLAILRRDAMGYADHATPNAAAWNEIEDIYWQQWIWPSIGAATRREELSKVTPFDLVYTTRYGSLPLLHWRGGNLSICQWSRLLDVARHRQRKAFDPPVRCGLANLGFGGQSQSTDRGLADRRPITMLLPRSDRSPAWSWQTDPRVRTLALMPPSIAQQDRIAALHKESQFVLDGGEVPFAPRLPEIAIDTARRGEASVALLQCTEIVEGEVSQRSYEDRLLPPAAWRNAYFGFDAISSSYRPYVSSPRDVGELVSAIERDYPDWFPAPEDAPVNFYLRLLIALRNAVRINWIYWRRIFAELSRWARRLNYMMRRLIAGKGYRER